MKRVIEQSVKIFMYGTFFVPLILVPSAYIFPFIVPKVLWLRSLIVLMLGGYAALLVVSWEEFKPKFTALNIAVLTFLTSFILSTFLGVDSYHSFWDNHERMLGLFTIFHYIIYYFVASAVFKNWSEWSVALKIFLIAGSIVMVLGIWQRLVDPTILLNQSGNRVASTLGNPIYVGGYGLFLFFASLLLFVREKNTAWKILSVLLGVTAFLGMIFSGTRGSLLGFLVAIGAAMAGYVVLLKENPRIRLVLSVLIGIAIVSFGVLYLKRTEPWVRNIPTLGNLLNASLYSGTGSTRVIAWKIAIEGWQERPVFGWGPNNYFYAFNKYYNPKSLDYGYGETWFDNAHNILLNTLTVQGLFGLLSYLLIFAVAILTLWQDRERRHKLPHVVVIGSAFLIAHLIQNITVFENPTSYLYFMFWLALINRMSPVYSPLVHQPVEAIKSPVIAKNTVPLERPVGWLTLGGITAISLLFIFIFNILPARANKKTLSALQILASNPTQGVDIVRDTLALSSPHIDDIRSDIARSVIQILGSGYDKLPTGPVGELFNLSYEAVKENTRLHPYDIRNYLYMAQLGQIGYLLHKQPTYMLEAEQYVATGLSYTPRRQQFIYMLSAIKAQLGKTGESVKLLEQAINDNPKIAESYWRLAYIYLLNNQKNKAQEVFRLAYSRGITFDGQGKQVEDIVMVTSIPHRGK